MANNQYVNKVVNGESGDVLIDLTADTITASSLMQGYTAHDASGAPIVGTSTGGSMVIRDEQDSHGGTIRHITAGSVVTGTVEITENGTYDVAQYADASVSVPAPEPELQSKSATPSETAQTITPDAGYDGLSQVSVGAISNTYVGSGITRRSSSNLTVSGATVTAPAGYYENAASKSVASGSASTPATTITANPSISVDSTTGEITATVSGSKSVTPTVSAGYVSSGTAGTVSVSGSNTSQLTTQAAKTVTPSTEAQTAVAAGRYTTGAVTVAAMPSGTAGTPTASKGTVSNHAVSVTPSVTNSTGYITGGTKTGTAVSVSASELVSGTLSITSSGTKDVTNYASASVAAGGATASATKGTVSNHSVAVTPSVTTTAGYITAGTSSGTAVTVSASELVSGTKSITANDTGIDVTNYASVDVAVPSVSPTLITKSITENGTYNASSDNADGYSSVTVNVSGGGGGGGDMSDPIRFFDYDGTLVASYSAVPASLPSVPSHSGLTNGAWNYTLQQVTTQFNAMGTCDVGANYETSSGKTEIDCEFYAGRLSPYLRLAVNGTVTIDWGDGSASETATGTSLSTRIDKQHTYAAPGSYTITIAPATGAKYSMFGTSTYTLFHKNSSTSNYNRTYADCVKSVRIGASCSIGNYSFYCCHSLKSISIPSSATSIGTYSFYYCYSLKHVSIPSGVASIGGNVFNFCPAMQTVSIPSSVTSIGSSSFYQCYSLQSISVPSGITSINNSAFYYCYSLVSLTFGSSFSDIMASAFTNCYGMAEYHFKSTTPPTLANINAFTGIQSDCIIYVPAASLTAYQEAENWSTYASYMVGE